MKVENSQFTISVVIPLYNKAEAVARTLKSVLNQSRLPDELIIVDDGSSDRSPEVAKELLEKAETQIKFTIISQKNAGVSVARNRGANASKMDYISFLDADDEWLPDYVLEVEKLARTYPDAGVLSIRSSKVNADGVIVPEPSPLPDPFFAMVDNMLDVYRRGYGVMHTSAVTVKRDIWERSEGFPPGARKSQDMHLWLQLCLTESFAHSSQPLSIWHDDFSGVSRRKGVVPSHFNYFLGTEEGRAQLRDTSLVKFLGSNMLIHIGGHRLTEDAVVVKQLRKLSSALPLQYRVKSMVISIVPIWCLNLLVWIRQRSRGLKR